jgi:hypothetical protein
MSPAFYSPSVPRALLLRKFALHSCAPFGSRGSSRTMAPGFTHPVEEMSTERLLAVKRGSAQGRHPHRHLRL